MGILGPPSRLRGAAGARHRGRYRCYPARGCAGVCPGKPPRQRGILDQDAYHTTLPRTSFDCIHVRFVFAPVVRDAELLQEILALTRPGGLSLSKSQMPVSQRYPAHPAWDRLKEAILAHSHAGVGLQRRPADLWYVTPC